MQRGVLRVGGDRLSFWCPGCEEMHGVRVAPSPDPWGFNGNYDRPTFTPSVLVTYRHPRGYTNENPAPLGFPSQKERPDLYVDDICHSFVTDGRIQFLGDCTHKLRGQTVELTLPDFLKDRS